MPGSRFQPGKVPANRLDLTGQRYGRYVAVEPDDRRRGKWRTHWICRCDCGRMSSVSVQNLRSGNSKSCGCARPKPSAYGTMRRVVSMRRHSAKKRGLEWELDVDEAVAILKMNCFYCGVAPFHSMSWLARDRGVVYGGFDRIDSRKGYVTGNVRPCCKPCNTAKMDMTESEFASWCERLSSAAWWKERRKSEPESYVAIVPGRVEK